MTVARGNSHNISESHHDTTQLFVRLLKARVKKYRSPILSHTPYAFTLKSSYTLLYLFRHATNSDISEILKFQPHLQKGQ